MNKADAVRYFGTQELVAARLGISRQAVSQWPDAVPMKAAMQLQVLTGGDLRMDPSMYPDLVKAAVIASESAQQGG